MFKTKNEIITIKAEATAPVNTGVVFWSHDRGTAKFIFQLTKDGVNQSLATGTLVPISLDFVIGDVKGKHIYHAVIEDAVNGIVSFVLQDQILWFQGKVTGSIYIELPDTRSLDSAGRFNFDIQRSPIDMTTPPEQHFYWDGFNEILQEYDKTIAYIKSESKKLLDNLTTNVTNAQTKVDKLEKDIETANTTLNNRIDEIHKKIDDEDVYRKIDVFTKEESSANVVNIVTGKEKVQMTFAMDFAEKISGSLLENPHFIGRGSGSTLWKPSAGWAENDTTQYQKGSTLNNDSFTFSTSEQGASRQVIFKYNILNVVQKALGENYFERQGMQTTELRVSAVKKLLKSLTPSVWGFGSGPAGNRLNISRYGNNAWGSPNYSTQNKVTKISFSTMDEYWFNYIIQNDGCIYIIAYAENSDGLIASTVNIDYANIEFTIELSVDEYFEYMIAANHVENIATKEEAEAGEDNTKIMTPLLTAEEIDRKTVSIAGNQTIGGIKNFKDGLLSDSLTVQAGMIEREITLADRSDTTNVTAVNGKITRIGNIVFIAFNFNCMVWPTNTDTRWILIIPDGYKRDSGSPSQTSLALTRNAAQPEDARAFLDNKNIIQVKSGNGSSYVAGMWTTKDDWPE